MRRHPALFPLLAAMTGIAIFSVMDATMKRAAQLEGVYVALLVRSALGAALMAPIWRLSGGRRPGPAALRMHITRGVVCAGMGFTFFWGLVRTPMAQAIAISFIAPLIGLYLAAVMLGERIRARPVIGSLLGLAGVVAITLERLGEAGHSDGGKGIAAILLSAVLYAWNLILQRQQAKLAGPSEVALFQSLCVGGTLALFAPWLGHTPGLPALGWIAAAAVLATVSLMLLSWAWGRAEAQVLMPVEYTAFIWSALAGFLIFAEPLTLATLAGAALIVAGCWIGALSHPADHIEQVEL